MSWLEDLRYIWECTKCPNHLIAKDMPDKCSGCGSSMYLSRCADLLGMVASDSLGDVVNPIDGKIYDSKSAYYKTVEAAGCNIVEDSPLERKRDLQGDFDITKELKDAVQEVEAKRGKVI